MILGKDLAEKWALYYFRNRRHDGEVWLAYETANGIRLMEQSETPLEGSTLLGEIETGMVDGEFVDEVVPLKQRSEAEQQQILEQAERHKAYRAGLYKRYSLDERIRDLRSAR